MVIKTSTEDNLPGVLRLLLPLLRCSGQLLIGVEHPQGRTLGQMTLSMLLHIGRILQEAPCVKDLELRISVVNAGRWFRAPICDAWADGCAQQDVQEHDEKVAQYMSSTLEVFNGLGCIDTFTMGSAPLSVWLLWLFGAYTPTLKRVHVGTLVYAVGHWNIWLRNMDIADEQGILPSIEELDKTFATFSLEEVASLPRIFPCLQHLIGKKDPNSILDPIAAGMLSDNDIACRLWHELES